MGSRIRTLWSGAVLAALCGPLSARPLLSQTFQILHAFQPSPSSPATRLIQGADGNFYGTTSDALDVGAGYRMYGSIFRMTPSGSVAILHRFSGLDGAGPNSLVQAGDGNFYGTTQTGGVGYGTIFRMTPGGTLTTLYYFGGEDGSYPGPSFVLATDGNLYGTTPTGGPYGFGTAFRISLGGTFAKLHDFAGPEGSGPVGLALGSDGNFYGVAAGGGTYNLGTFFQITTAGALTAVYSFVPQPFGSSSPADLVQGNDGAFYVTFSNGGPAGFGMICRITTAGVLTPLNSFYGGDPENPNGLILGTDGEFYGTASAGGLSGDGAVFSMSPAGATTVLHWFIGSDGAGSAARLVQGSDGNFYGTTAHGGANQQGTIFRITPAGVFTSLFSFGPNEGYSPEGGVVQAADGNFYGTTAGGGALGYGTIFSLSPSGAFATLSSLTGANGANPVGTLVQGTNGSLFGTTYAGGATGVGTLFSVTTSGVVTGLHSFSGPDGGHPFAGLVQGADGNFYGTTSHFFPYVLGTVFRATPAGDFTTLHAFGTLEGSDPQASLVLGSDGKFYGAASGGAFGLGTLFRISPGGVFETLHSFTGADSAIPIGLTPGLDGNFYGTTQGGIGGPVWPCTVFRMTPTGDVTTLWTFPLVTNWECPAGPLVREGNGSFLGMTTGYKWGIFEITPAGALTTLHSFSSADGTFSSGPLVIGSDGNIYGTMSGGGPTGSGVVFRLTPSGSPTPEAVVSGGGTICQGSGVAIQAALTGTPPWNLTWSDGISQNGVTASPATRVVSPVSSMVYTLAGISDANGPGTSSGYAMVPVTPTLSKVLLPPGTLVVCGNYAVNSVSAVAAGGGSVSYQWGYRTTSGGATTPIPFANSQWIYPTDTMFPAAGTYYLVATATPACGSPVTSNELVVIVPGLTAPVITVPSTISPSAVDVGASVPSHAGSTYSWSITSGTITSGQGSSQITFTPSGPGTVKLYVVEISHACQSPTGTVTVRVAAPTSFYPLAPCRELDTRVSSAPIGPGNTLLVSFLTGPCSISSAAQSVSANVTVTQPAATGNLTIYPADQPMPGTSSISFRTGATRANNAMLMLSADGNGAVSVFNNSTGTVHVIIDVNGYFQ